MYLVNDGKSAHATLPTQQKSTLLPRVPTHGYTDCEISDQVVSLRGFIKSSLEYQMLVIQKNIKKKDAQLALCLTGST